MKRWLGQTWRHPSQYSSDAQGVLASGLDPSSWDPKLQGRQLTASKF